MPPSHQYNCRKLADFCSNSNLTFVTQAVSLTVEPRKVVTVAHKQFLRIAAFKSNYWVESEDFSCFFAVITPSPATTHTPVFNTYHHFRILRKAYPSPCEGRICTNVTSIDHQGPDLTLGSFFSGIVFLKQLNQFKETLGKV